MIRLIISFKFLKIQYVRNSLRKVNKWKWDRINEYENDKYIDK